MEKNRSRMHALFSAIGLILFTTGLVLIKFSQDAEGILRTLPYICIGIGKGDHIWGIYAESLAVTA